MTEFRHTHYCIGSAPTFIKRYLIKVVRNMVLQTTEQTLSYGTGSCRDFAVLF